MWMQQRARSLAVLLLVVASTAGAATCEKCLVEVPEGRTLCPACQAKLDAIKVVHVNEMGLVDAAAQARLAYEQALEALLQYYRGIGDAAKIKRARQELTLLRRLPYHRHLAVGDLLKNVQPPRPVPEADKLYKEARQYQTQFALWGWKRKYLQAALDRYRYILTTHPDSNKLVLASYQMGMIYASPAYEDYPRAARCFEKCFEWDPHTTVPARYMAARIYDRKLHDPNKALELYELSAKTEDHPDYRPVALGRIRKLKAKLEKPKE